MKQSNAPTLCPYRGPTDHDAVAKLDHLMGLGILNYCDPTQDIIFAESAGQLVGYGRIWHNHRETDERLFLEISPVDTSDVKTESILYDWLDQRSQSIRQTLPPDRPCSRKVFVKNDRESLQCLLQNAGYTVERTDLTMHRRLIDPLPMFAYPTGVESRPVRWEDSKQILAVMAATFGDAELDASTTLSEAEFDAWLSGMPATATASSCAWRVQEQTIVSVTMNQIDSEQGSATLSQVATHPVWQRQGIARTQICECLQKFRQMGLGGVTVEVNDFNAPAIRLYEQLGFEVVSSLRLYQLTC